MEKTILDDDFEIEKEKLEIKNKYLNLRIQ